MQVSERTAGDVTIIDATGRMTRNDGFGTLKEKVEALLAGGSRRLLITLDGVDYIDSTGVGELVSTFITIRNSGGTLRLSGARPRIRDLLAVAKLDTILDVHDTEASALDSDPTP